MSVKILIIGDTHLNSFKKLPKEMVQAIKESDWVIHVGDYTSIDIVEGLIRWKGDKFKGVFGNADPLSIRKILPDKVILEIKEKRIGITHPFCGGPETFTKARVKREFKDYDVDAIVFGHTHEPEIIEVNKILLINPGKGYLEKSSFGTPTTLAILTVTETLQAEIINIAL